MKSETETRFFFPQEPLGEDEINRRLADAETKIVQYDYDDENKDEYRAVLGFMGTAPHPMAVEGYQRFLRLHPNNIGEHTCGIDEEGFTGTQQLEREAISMMGDLHGDPDVNGYLSLDGTEANIHACWVARELLMRVSGSRHARVCLVVSHLAHYSFQKAYDILRLGGEFLVLPTDRCGMVDVKAMEREIRSAHSRGERRFILVAIGGSTLLGSVDDTKAIGDLVDRLDEEFNRSKGVEEGSPDYVGFFLHVDAAYGGFVTPFMNPPIKIGFNAHPRVLSMTIDPHKMGLSVYPGGTYLCRRGIIEVVSSPVSYIGGGRNVTLAGSRPGAEAAACWSVINALGRSGYQSIVARCMVVAEVLDKRLREHAQFDVYDHKLNIISFGFKGFTEAEIAHRLEEVGKMFTIVPAKIPSDLSNPKSPERTIVHCVIMPHRWVLERGEEIVNKLVITLKEAFTLP